MTDPSSHWDVVVIGQVWVEIRGRVPPLTLTEGPRQRRVLLILFTKIRGHLEFRSFWLAVGQVVALSRSGCPTNGVSGA